MNQAYVPACPRCGCRRPNLYKTRVACATISGPPTQESIFECPCGATFVDRNGAIASLASADYEQRVTQSLPVPVLGMGIAALLMVVCIIFAVAAAFSTGLPYAAH